MSTVKGIIIIGAMIIFGIHFIKQREAAGGYKCGSGLLGKKCLADEDCVNDVCTKKPAVVPPGSVTICTGGKVYDSVSKTCVPSCGTGQIYDTVTKTCVSSANATAQQQCNNQCQTMEEDFGDDYNCIPELNNGVCNCRCTRDDDSSNRVRAFLASGKIPFQDPRMTVQDISNIETAYNAIDGQTLPFFRDSFDKTRHTKMRFSGKV